MVLAIRRSAMAPYPSIVDDISDRERELAERGRPHAVRGRVPAGDAARSGRRVVLGMLGLGGAGVVWGAKAQSGLERLLRPITLNDRTGLTGFLPDARAVPDLHRHRRPAEPQPTPTTGSRSTARSTARPPSTSTTCAARCRRPSLTADFQCVTGWRVDDVPWKGVQLGDLLDDVGVQPEATHVRFHCFDGVYTETLTLEQARRDDVLVAHHMDGKPVTREHGGPVRLYVAPMYGYKSLKWLERIEVADALDRPTDPGYWENARLRHRRLGRATPTAASDEPDRDRRRSPRSTPSSATGRALRPRRAGRCTGPTPRCSSSCWPPGMTLYVGHALRLVGRRVLVKDIHVISRAAPAGAARSWPTPAAGGPACAATCAAWPAGRSTTAAGSSAGAAEAGALDGQVQRRPEAQRDLRGRLHPGDAGHRRRSCGGSSPFPTRVAHRRHLRARLDRPGPARGGRRPHRQGAGRPDVAAAPCGAGTGAGRATPRRHHPRW